MISEVPATLEPMPDGTRTVLMGSTANACTGGRWQVRPTPTVADR